jgi:hypothetical protein
VGGLGEHKNRRAGVGGREGGRESGDSGSDDDHVGCVAFLPHNR